MKKIIWFSFFCALSLDAIAQQPINNFTHGSYKQIVNQYKQQPFVMVLWSLDCPPCYKELELLADERRKHDFNLVLISTDGADARNEVASVLNKYNLQSVNSWLFDEFSSQHLRYEIDPAWYGELPRSYLFDSVHQRKSISGVLSTDQLPK